MEIDPKTEPQLRHFPIRNLGHQTWKRRPEAAFHV